MKADIIVYITSLALLVGLVALVWTQKTTPQNASLLQIIDKAYGTNTSLVDTLFNTWTFFLDGSTLTYNWQASGLNPITLWDSDNGACDYTENIASLTAAVTAGTVVYLNSGLILGQTPMYIDDLGIQRTFQLKMYAGDVRIESTNGERARSGSGGGGILSAYPSFWSIWARDITGATDYINTPTSWPLPFTDVIWQNVSDNFGFVAQFQTSGDIVVHATYDDNNFFQASKFQYTCS